MPVLYVLGGANGVGKTTWYQTGIENNAINSELPFINIDAIVLRELGGYTAENIVRGEQLAKERMGALISAQNDFMIESNLSKAADYEWIELMRKSGYSTILFFLGTNNVEINKMRVQARVSEGGHDVAEAIIVQRYNMGMSYIKSKVLDFSESTFIDVSTYEPKRMAYLKSGHIEFREINCPKWVEDCLYIPKRMAEKRMKTNEIPKQLPGENELF